MRKLTLLYLFVALATAVVAPAISMADDNPMGEPAASAGATTQPTEGKAGCKECKSAAQRIADLEAKLAEIAKHGLRRDDKRVHQIEKDLARARAHRHDRDLHREVRNFRDNRTDPLVRLNWELVMRLRAKDVISDDDLKALHEAQLDLNGKTRLTWAEFVKKHGVVTAPAKTEGTKPTVETDAEKAPKAQPAPDKDKAPAATGPSVDSAGNRAPAYQPQVVNAAWSGGNVRVQLVGEASEETPAPSEGEAEAQASDIKVLARRGEEVIPGVTVVLYSYEHAEIVRGVTGPKEGRITFKGVPDGDYYVRVESFPGGYFPAEVTTAVGGKDAANEVTLEFVTAGDLEISPTVAVDDATVNRIANAAASEAARQTAAKEVKVTANLHPAVYVALLVCVLVALLLGVQANRARGAVAQARP